MVLNVPPLFDAPFHFGTAVDSVLVGCLLFSRKRPERYKIERSFILYFFKRSWVHGGRPKGERRRIRNVSELDGRL